MFCWEAEQQLDMRTSSTFAMQIKWLTFHLNVSIHLFIYFFSSLLMLSVSRTVRCSKWKLSVRCGWIDEKAKKYENIIRFSSGNIDCESIECALFHVNNASQYPYIQLIAINFSLSPFDHTLDSSKRIIYFGFQWTCSEQHSIINS